MTLEVFGGQAYLSLDPQDQVHTPDCELKAPAVSSAACLSRRTEPSPPLVSPATHTAAGGIPRSGQLLLFPVPGVPLFLFMLPSGCF